MQETFEKLGPAILEKLNGERVVGMCSFRLELGLFHVFTPIRDEQNNPVGYTEQIFPRTSVAQITKIGQEAMVLAQTEIAVKALRRQVERLPQEQNYVALGPAPETARPQQEAPSPPRHMTAAESTGLPIQFDSMGIPIYVNQNLDYHNDSEGAFGSGE